MSLKSNQYLQLKTSFLLAFLLCKSAYRQTDAQTQKLCMPENEFFPRFGYFYEEINFFLNFKVNLI